MNSCCEWLAGWALVLAAIFVGGCNHAASSQPSDATSSLGKDSQSGAAVESPVVETPNETESKPPQPTETASEPVEPATPAENSASSEVARDDASPDAEARARTNQNNDELVDISFADLELKEMKADQKFDLSMLTDRVKELDGRRVRIRGFIHPGTTFQLKNLTQFLMVKQSNCPFGKGGTAYHNMKISLPEKAAIDFTTKAIAVDGTLRVKPWDGPDGNTWYLYEMEGERAK